MAARARCDIGATPAWFMWMYRSASGKRCRASAGSMLILQPRGEHRLQGDDVIGHGVDRLVEHALVQLYRRQRLIETRPPSVPWLQLGARQLRFDFQHVGAEEVQSLLVLFARALEVQSD